MTEKAIRGNKHQALNVVCDVCGNVCQTEETTAQEARLQARGWEWKRILGQDVCDVCVDRRNERNSVAGRIAQAKAALAK